MKKVYLLTTRNLGDYYVIADNSDDAAKKLTEKLTKADYGFSDDRKIIDHRWLADEIYDFADKPHFSNKDNRLIL